MIFCYHIIASTTILSMDILSSIGTGMTIKLHNMTIKYGTVDLDLKVLYRRYGSLTHVAR
jgi:hypothetical protein